MKRAREGRNEGRGTGWNGMAQDGIGQYGTGRNATERVGTGQRDGTDRGTERDREERNGTKSNVTGQIVLKQREERNGTERNGTRQIGMERDREERNGVERNGTEQKGPELGGGMELGREGWNKSERKERDGTGWHKTVRDGMERVGTG